MASAPTSGQAAWVSEVQRLRTAGACRDACDDAYLCRSLTYYEATTDGNGAEVASRCILYAVDHGCAAALATTTTTGASTHYKLATRATRANGEVTYTEDYKSSTGLQSTGPTSNQACE